MLLRWDYAAVVEPIPYERERFKVLEDLSYAIDAGRLYFPNSEADKYGLHKESAFRGVRHPVLDMLVRVYDLLREGHPPSSRIPGGAERAPRAGDLLQT
jgi:phytoene/squalene synthetase